MACDTKQIKKDTFSRVKKLIETKTIKMDSNGVVRFNYKDSEKYNKNSISYIADGIIKRVHEGRNIINQDGQKEKILGMNETFKNKYLTANIILKGEDADGIFLQYRFPKELERAYEMKNKEFTQEEIDQAYRQRDEIYQKEIEDYETYSEVDFFDDMMTIDETETDGFKYANYIGVKENLRNRLQKKVKILENKLDKSNPKKKDFIQIEEIKNIVRRLNIDLKNLKSTDATLVNYFNYFQNDLEVISEMLDRGDLELIEDILENQSIDNLDVVESYIRTLKTLTSTGEGGFLSKDLEDIKDKEIYNRFVDFGKELAKQEKKHNSQKEKLIQSLINEYLEFSEKDLTPKQRKEKVIKLYEDKIRNQIEDLSVIEMLVHTVDSSEKSLPNQIMMTIFNNAHAKKQHVDIQQRMVNSKTKVIAELKKLGHINNRSWIGSLYNPVTYQMFFRRAGDGSNRLAQKFSLGWFNFKKLNERALSKIRDSKYKKNKTDSERLKISREENSLFKDIDSKSNFIDVNRIPEILEDEDFRRYADPSVTSAQAAEYKKKVIDDIGEIEYYKLITDQKVKLYSYLTTINQYRKRLEAEYGENIPETKFNFYLETLYKDSPFIFGRTYRETGSNKISKKYIYEGETRFTSGGYDINANLEYMNYYPKKDSDLYDKEFENDIESNPTLKEAWKLMDKALIYINQNGHSQFNKNIIFDNSLVYHRNSFQAHLTSGKSIIPLLRNRTMDWIKKIISTSRYQDPSNIDKIEIKGGIRTVDEIVTEQAKIHYKALDAKSNTVPSNAVPYSNLPKDVREYLDSITMPNTNLSFQETGEKMTVQNMLTQILSEKVMNEQEIDIFDSLINQMDIVSNFKAKREIETKLKFLFAETERIKKDSRKVLGFDINNRSNFLGKFFLEKNLYNIDNSANWSPKDLMAKVYTSDEKEMRKVVDDTLKILKDQDLSPTIEKEIRALEVFKDSQGKVITAGSIFEAFVLKLPRFKAFAMNLKAQVTNYMMGDFNARQVDGLKWTDGNYDKAKSFVRKWKKHLKKQSKKDYQLTDLLLNRLDLFQNSANEIYKVKQSIVHKETFQKILADPATVLNPTKIVGLVEKSIQRPQILARMGDLKITDEDGNEYPVFNINDLKNPWPAFDISTEGNLILKENFRTKDNVATWINNSSLDYARLFGESGDLPQLIAYVNGDYRDSSTYALEKWSLTKVLFMFKRWMPATILKNLGIYKELGELGQAHKANFVTGMNATLRAVESGTYAGTLGLATAIGFYTILGGVRLSRRGISENLESLKAIAETLSFELVKKGFTKGSRIFAAGLIKTTQQVVNSLTGGHTISNELINSVAGFNEIEGTEEQIKDSQARLQFLLAGFARTLNFTVLRMAIHALLFPDDDEEENYDKDENFYTRLFKDFDITTFYALENLSSSLLEDTNIFMSLESLERTFGDTRTLDQLLGLFASINTQLSEGDLKSGPNVGRNRLLVQMERTWKPSMLDDMAFGFNSVSKYDFNTKDPISKAFRSDKESLNEERLKLRTKRKLELQKEYKDKFKTKEIRDKRINKELSRDFPTIKKHFFTDDGELKPRFEENKWVKKYK